MRTNEKICQVGLRGSRRQRLQAAICLGLGGLGGLVYTLQVMVVVRRQSDYAPVLEDWLGHIVIPATAYLAFVVAAEPTADIGRRAAG